MDAKGEKRLSDFISNKDLTKLDLSKCKVTDEDCEQIAKLIGERNITVIALTGNNIHTRGLQILGDVLKKNTFVTTFDIDLNNNQDAKVIVDMLVENTSIYKFPSLPLYSISPESSMFMLGRHTVSKEYIKKISDALKANESYRKISKDLTELEKLMKSKTYEYTPTQIQQKRHTEQAPSVFCVSYTQPHPLIERILKLIGSLIRLACIKSELAINKLTTCFEWLFNIDFLEGLNIVMRLRLKHFNFKELVIPSKIAEFLVLRFFGDENLFKDAPEKKYKLVLFLLRESAYDLDSGFQTILDSTVMRILGFKDTANSTPDFLAKIKNGKFVTWQNVLAAIEQLKKVDGADIAFYNKILTHLKFYTHEAFHAILNFLDAKKNYLNPPPCPLFSYENLILNPCNISLFINRNDIDANQARTELEQVIEKYKNKAFADHCLEYWYKLFNELIMDILEEQQREDFSISSKMRLYSAEDFHCVENYLVYPIYKGPAASDVSLPLQEDPLPTPTPNPPEENSFKQFLYNLGGDIVQQLDFVSPLFSFFSTNNTKSNDSESKQSDQPSYHHNLRN